MNADFQNSKVRTTVSAGREWRWQRSASWSGAEARFDKGRVAQ